MNTNPRPTFSSFHYVAPDIDSVKPSSLDNFRSRRQLMSGSDLVDINYLRSQCIRVSERIAELQESKRRVPIWLKMRHNSLSAILSNVEILQDSNRLERDEYIRNGQRTDSEEEDILSESDPRGYEDPRDPIQDSDEERPLTPLSPVRLDSSPLTPPDYCPTQCAQKSEDEVEDDEDDNTPSFPSNSFGHGADWSGFSQGQKCFTKPDASGDWYSDSEPEKDEECAPTQPVVINLSSDDEWDC